MNIKIERLELLNFKGIRELTVDFSDTTNVMGDNATGKTTVADAFFWALFGKDSAGRSDFNIKTLDQSGVAIPKIEHEVVLHLNIDGDTTVFKRVLRERWVKRRGATEVVFDGNETVCFVDEVPHSVGEYQKRVDGVVSEEMFRMITNPLHFNSLGWQERRKVLTEIVGAVDDREIMSSSERFRALLDVVSKKSLEEYKRELASKKRTIKDELSQIPARIDEVSRNIPESEELEELESDVQRLEGDIAEIEAQISDRSKVWESKNAKLRESQERVFDLKSKQQHLVNQAKLTEQERVHKANAQRRELERELKAVERDCINAEEAQSELSQKLESENSRREELLEKWHRENERQLVLSADIEVCPTCSRPFEQSDVEAKREELLESFNSSKVKRLQQISKEGGQVKERIEGIEKEIEAATEGVKALRERKVNLSSKLENSPEVEVELEIAVDELEVTEEYIELQEQIEELEKSIEKPTVVDNSTLEGVRRELQESLSAIKKRLGVREHIAKLTGRKKELLSEQKTQAQALADLEKQEAVVAEFIKTKISMIEERVNAKFNYVSFRMFDTLINGGETEVCDTLINGVPFSDTNSAAQINAGIDIINVLCDHYGVTAPIFIDNRESVNELIATNSQIINLIVTKDKELVIN